MKNYKLSLMAAVLCGLSLSFSACSDDDDDEKNGNQQEQTQMPQGASDDATVLASFLSAWVEDFADEATSSLLSKTYTATVGEMTDASQQTVRSMVVKTQEAADAYAHEVLDVVGATASTVNGFEYSNGAIGTVKYHRGSGNELGVIDLNVKQLPGFTRLRLLKDNEGNAPVAPYYQKGDIVKYSKDGKYYICLQDHEGSANATWISFDCGEDVKKQTTGTCGWLGTGDDIYYKDNQVKPQNLYTWLKEFVMSDEGYKTVLQHLMAKNLPLTAINQIVPSNITLRNDFLNNIYVSAGTTVLDVNSIVGDDLNHTPRASQYWEYRDNGTGSGTIRTFYPFGLLLAGPARWSMGWTFQYWVPNMVLVHHDDEEKFVALLNQTESQYKWPGYFKFERWGQNVKWNNDYYDIYTIATYWTHVAFKYGNTNYKCLLNFVQNRRTLEGKVVNLNDEQDLDWTLHNITSKELSVKDNGEKYKYFEDIYRGKANDNPSLSQVQPGYVLCSNGKCYANKTLANIDKATPVGMVVHVGAVGSAESGTQYNALAMALEDASYIDVFNKKETTFKWRSTQVEGVCTSTCKDNLSNAPIDGLAMTSKLRTAEACKSHDHEIVTKWPVSSPVSGNNKFSQWFIPSIGQWILALRGMGFTVETTYISGNGSFKWQQAGVPEGKLSDGLYLSTTQDSEQPSCIFGVYVNGNTGNPTMFDVPYEGEHLFRPFVAFTVNN